MYFVRRFAVVLSPFTGVVVSLAGTLSAQGADVLFIERVISTTAEVAFSVFAIDVDGDGDIDVLSASWGDDKIAWYENDGGSPPSFTERVITEDPDGLGGVEGFASGAYSVFAMDLDGDGDIDVLSASLIDDKIAWYENDGGSPPNFTERVISTNADAPRSVFAADLDGDGDTDVLSASDFDNKIAWYENDGGSPPNFAERVISTTADRAQSVFATDLDGDGDIDVLSASVRDHKISWYQNIGDRPPPTFTERVISFTAGTAWSVFAADVNGDGNIDVLSASAGDDKIAWYESNGVPPPIFTRRLISSSATQVHSVFAADLDGDGDVDVLSASRVDDTIAWYENDGALRPSFTERVISTTADGASSVFAMDLDGDGDIDVLSASAGDNKIAWYENLSPCVLACATVEHLDIKPGSCPNQVNSKAKGVVPVALVGSDAFDINDVDVSSVVLGRRDGVGSEITPATKKNGRLHASIEDVATPLDGTGCDCHELGGDGIDDLILKFSTPEMSRAFELDGLPRGSTVELVLRGSGLDGRTFEATDCIAIVVTERDSRGQRGEGPSK